MCPRRSFSSVDSLTHGLPDRELLSEARHSSRTAKPKRPRLQPLSARVRPLAIHVPFRSGRDEHTVAAQLPDDQIVSLPQRAFTAAFKNAQHDRRRLFLELFSGRGGVSSQLIKKGHGVLSFEIRAGPQFDLLSPRVEKIITGWITSGCVAGVWFGTPCSSFSRARHGPEGSSWGPIRNASHIWGISNFSSRDKAKIQLGNACAKLSCRITTLCNSLGVPVLFENPRTSMLWKVPPLQRLLRAPTCVMNSIGFFQHCARWRKRTGVAGWHVGTIPILSRRCSGRTRMCSRSGLHHIILKGTDKASGLLWTVLAEPYPPSFAAAAASALITASDQQHLRRLLHIGVGISS